MVFPGPLPISPSQPAASLDLGLRPFQRVTAQVLAVTPTTAVLAIEGHPVVAQLGSPDQAAALHSQGTAQFIVSRLAGQEITLKLIQQDGLTTTETGSTGHGSELALRLLAQSGIPVNAGNLALARAVLHQGLPLAPGLLKELLSALAESGPWGQAEANLAAALKAAGLPVTPASLALAARQAAQTGEALGLLIAQMQSAGQSLPPDLLKEIRRSVQMLEKLVLHANDEPARLAAQLESAVRALGRSLERTLLEGAQHQEMLDAENSLLSLARLEGSLRQAGETELAAAVEAFLGGLRRRHFLNARPEPGLGQASWIEIGFRLEGGKGTCAHLRVLRDSSASPGDIDPAFTRLVLQVDLSENETVEVDLSLTGKSIGAQVTAPDTLWCQQAERELPSLEQALQELGYRLGEARVHRGDPHPFERLKVASAGAPLMTVNIEA